METYTNDAEPQADAVLSVDRTVSNFLAVVGIVIGFALMISTFLQVNRATTNRSKADSRPLGIMPGLPEIGAVSNAKSG
jgi:hypothetical protein